MAMTRPFTLDLNPWKREAAMISEDDGVFVVEPMRFVTLPEAKREAKAARKLAA